ncbi:unnamed protein product [Rangifer tarandus platyrhynchus]|uniref:Uncharacterized protein n=1 Tax=Rangifer tarandus platyrhynchus TaxID=3082113 RepID=A0AC59YRF5_RANTA
MKPREGSDQLGAQWILDLWNFAPDGSPSSVTLQPRLVCAVRKCASQAAPPSARRKGARSACRTISRRPDSKAGGARPWEAPPPSSRRRRYQNAKRDPSAGSTLPVSTLRGLFGESPGR